MAGLIERAGVRQFLRGQPRLAIRPSSSGLLIQGILEVHVIAAGKEIHDEYRLSIFIPEAFPKAAPVVREVGNRIPKDPDHHVSFDGTLCLGSPLRVLGVLAGTPTMEGFAIGCILPYLAAMSYRERHGGALLFGELKHGIPGEIEDYANLLGLTSPAQVKRAIALLAMKRRVANKRLCPCDCGRYLGRCALHRRLSPLRKLATRRWFKERAIALASY